MHPILSFAGLNFQTGIVFLIVFALLAGVYFCYGLKSEPLPKKVTVWFVTMILGVLGARLFHVLFERPRHFLENPGSIFTALDGMTFYGTFIAIFLFLYLLPKNYWNRLETRAKVWDMAALIASFGYGFLRLSCFLSGCCWGKITTLPWGVSYYHPASAMPVKGIPVHPVQLYDAFLGFLIFGILVYVKKKNLTEDGELFRFFCVLYPIARFFTEEYRGDQFRGEDILLGLSTSQILSLVIVAIAFYTWLKGIFDVKVNMQNP